LEQRPPHELLGDHRRVRLDRALGHEPPLALRDDRAPRHHRREHERRGEQAADHLHCNASVAAPRSGETARGLSLQSSDMDMDCGGCAAALLYDYTKAAAMLP